jgi:deoxyguanosine kinase
MYIAIEGNIGAGKSSLATRLARHYDARLVLEQFADNDFLAKFYQDAERYAFPLELSFLADRYMQLKELLLNPDLFQQKIVSDYLFTKSKLFAKVNLKEHEYDLFQKLFEIIDPKLRPPDLLIYLHAPIRQLQQNIQKRGRIYEQNIGGEYLEKIQDVYRQFLKQEMYKTLVIDTSVVDFRSNPAHFNAIIDFLEKDYDYKTHYLSVD